MDMTDTAGEIARLRLELAVVQAQECTLAARRLILEEQLRKAAAGPRWDVC